MKHVYELTLSNGTVMLNTQDFKFTEQAILERCQASKIGPFNEVVKVEFIKSIPNGYHVCGCGNVVEGDNDELCDECKSIYGHTYEHEL